MNTRIAVSLILSLGLVVAILFSLLCALPPAPRPVDAPTDRFSAERALVHVQAISQEPRLPGTAAWQQAREYVATQLQLLGLEPIVQQAESRDYVMDVVQAFEIKVDPQELESMTFPAIENTLVRIPGTDPSAAVLLVAHLDTVAGSPGAADDASGVAVLLETARALVAGPPLRHPVILLFADQEEIGFYGALCFVFGHPWAREVEVVFNFDAGGRSGPAVLTAASPGNGWLIRNVAQTADRSLIGNSISVAIADSQEDFSGAFRPAGFSGLSSSLYWDKRIHHPSDTIENLDPASVQHQGEHALALARHFANLDTLRDPREPDRVFFNLFNLGVVHYPATWSLPITLLVGALFAGVSVYGFRRRILTWRGSGQSLVAFLVSLALVLPAYWVTDAAFVRPASAGYDEPIILPWHAGVLVLLSTAAIVLWYALFRRLRPVPAADLAFAPLALVMLCTLVLTFVFPVLHYVLAWPLFFALPALAWWFAVPRCPRFASTAGVGLLVSGAITTAIYVPLILALAMHYPLVAASCLAIYVGFLIPFVCYVSRQAIRRRAAKHGPLRREAIGRTPPLESR
jgi:hypothetical protein